MQEHFKEHLWGAAERSWKGQKNVFLPERATLTLLTSVKESPGKTTELISISERLLRKEIPSLLSVKFSCSSKPFVSDSDPQSALVFALKTL